MGLAASQARLLTITARKSDCEYQSMAYSHQKIALSRDMNVVSAEYQDALNQTKLVYDFYGTGDTSTQLSYGLLMQPSKLNDYMPSPITDTSGRVVLDAKLAAAARAAGIPQEGLGTTPSSDVRNKFVQSMIKTGVVTPVIGSGIQEVQYNPNAGLGSSDIITFGIKPVNYENFVNNYLNDIKFDFSEVLQALNLNKETDHGIGLRLLRKEGNTYQSYSGSDNLSGISDISIADILRGDVILYGLDVHQDSFGKDKNPNNEGGLGQIIDAVGSFSYWDVLFEALGSYLDPTDSKTQAALEYAKKQTLNQVEYIGQIAEKEYKKGGRAETSNSAYTTTSGTDKDDWNMSKNFAEGTAGNYVGYIYRYYKNDDSHPSYGLDISNMTKAYLTYFAQYMEGLTSSEYDIAKEVNNCKFIDDNFVFNIRESVDTSGDSLLIANFYDTLFNQIATQGWVQNEQVTDNDYLQTMLQNGSMYISTLGDDSYYYQSNYATNSYIKEVTDEESIAQAEAKYNREKQKINHKENILDVKMKNLDTEISALTTEYDTVKSVISKNIEKSFKRYNA